MNSEPNISHYVQVAKSGEVMYMFTPERFDNYWPFLSKLMDKRPRVWDSSFTKDSFYKDVMEGNYQVWGCGEPGFIELFVVTKLYTTPLGRVCYVSYVVGKNFLRYMTLVEATINNFAAEQECILSEVQITSPAVMRWAQRCGFEYSYSVFSRPVVEGRKN